MSVGRNSLWNLGGALVPLATSLITIPFYLRFMGEARYGVLSIAWLFLGYFGVFDLGLSRATAQNVAAAKGQRGTIERIVGTAAAANIALGLIGGIVLYGVIRHYFAQFSGNDPSLGGEAIGVAGWLALSLPVATLSGVLTGSLQGHGLFKDFNLVNLIGTVAAQIVPLVAAAVWGGTLAVVLPASVVMRLAMLLAYGWVVWRKVLDGEAPRFDRAALPALVGFGGWVTVSSLVGPLMVIGDRLLIGMTRGPSAVSHYTVPFQLAERSVLFSHAIAGATFPGAVTADEVAAREMSWRALSTIMALMTAMIVPAILGLELFFRLWLGAAFAHEAEGVGRILLLGFWFNTIGVVLLYHLQARGRPRFVALCHLAELAPYFAALYFGLTTLGLVGAAFAFSLRCAADMLLLAWGAGLSRKLVRTAGLPMVCLAGAELAAIYAPLSSTHGMIVAAGVLVAAAVAAKWSLPAEELTRFWRQIVRRIPA